MYADSRNNSTNASFLCVHAANRSSETLGITEFLSVRIVANGPALAASRTTTSVLKAGGQKLS